MPSTYTSSLRLTLPASGELDGSWGEVVNDQITSMIEQAVAGYLNIAMADANTTLTTANGSDDQARNMILRFSGALTANRNITVPSVEKLYVIKNATSGGFSLVVKTAAGTGVTVPAANLATLVYCDGTNVHPAVTWLESLTTPTVGPTSTQQHTLPAVASDTVALLAASQTLANKTLTNPLLNGIGLVGPNVATINTANPTSGTTVTLVSTDVVYINSNAGTKAALTFDMPAAPTNGLIQKVATAGQITAVTVTAPGGASVVGAPTTLAAGGFFEMQYRSSNTTWYRIG